MIRSVWESRTGFMDSYHRQAPASPRSTFKVSKTYSLEPLEERALLIATPYLGVPFAIEPNEATVVEAEHFDGGEGGYSDLDGRSDGINFRPLDTVDITTGTTGGSTGFAVQSFKPGEWLNYTTNVHHHGDYDITARVSSSAAVGSVGGYFHLEFRPYGEVDADSTGLMIVPGTGGVGNWVEIKLRGVHLGEGAGLLGLVSDFGNIAIDWFKIAPSADVHVGDANAADEHHVLEDLVDPADASHVAVRSGNWSDPGTWAFGVLPNANANVWIPESVAVNYDVSSTTPIRTIRVDGTFSFSTNKSTRLYVDTIAVLRTGRYVQGTLAAPIAANVTSEIVFTDTGAIDRVWDPTEISRGLISHGSVSIQGAVKNTYTELVNGPTVGARSITLTTAPTGWRVGDAIVIGGVRARDANVGDQPSPDTSFIRQIVSEDEVRIVTSIVGNTVTFDQPLVYDHRVPSGVLDTRGRSIKTYVANLTRNIVLRSANTDYTNNAAMHRHGHVMFMHSDQVAVSYAQFLHLGRTNKAIPLDDIRVEASSNKKDLFTSGTGTNVRGRYALHLHITGVNGNGVPIPVIGNSVVGGTGWGYVNHGSNVIFEQNVAYDIPGAAFVEEDGRGIGAFRKNISIKTTGTGRTQYFGDDGTLRDLGFSGHGFFFRGNITEIEDNVVLSAAHSGYAWANKGDARLPINDLTIPASALQDPELTLGADSIDWEAAPTKIFRRNVTFASNMAIAASFWMEPHTTQHDARTEIRDFTGWNLYGDVGSLIHYTRSLTVINMKLSRDPALGRGTYGLQADTSTAGDHVYNNVDVTGYNFGLYSKPTSNGLTQRFFIFDNSDFVTGNGAELVDSTNVLRVAVSSLPTTSVLNFVGTAEPVRDEGGLGVGLYVSGTKTDKLGTEAIAGRGSTLARFYLGRDVLEDLMGHGYYTDAQGAHLMIPILISDRVTLETKVVYVRAAFNPNGYPNLRVGPNLGSFAGPRGRVYRSINSGGSLAGDFQTDQSVVGGSNLTTANYIDASARLAAPQRVYRDARVGASTYTLTGLVPNTVYTVRLHFAEIEKTLVGERRFDVKIGGKTVLDDFDILLAAGAKDRAVIREFVAATDASGRIVVEFSNGSIGLPLVSGIEIATQRANLIVAEPSIGTGTGSFTEAQRVTITSDTPGTTIYYTLDGSTPSTSSRRYTDALFVEQTTTIRAIAIAAGYVTSTVQTAVITINPSTAPYRLKFGGEAVAGFAADSYLVGYLQNGVVSGAIDTSNPGVGPADLYRSYATLRHDYDFWLSLPNLEPNQEYRLKMHFIEPVYTAVGDRRFDVTVNGTQVLNDFDIVAAAGGANKAVVREFRVRTDMSGQLLFFFNAGPGRRSYAPIISALEILV
jgi:hypothetical protein